MHTPTKKEIKSMFLRDLGIHASNIPEALKKGKLPKTKAIMERCETDLRSPTAWLQAYYEIKDMTPSERFCFSYN